jgi:uncharacterized protein (TIGR03067 family)
MQPLPWLFIILVLSQECVLHRLQRSWKVVTLEANGQVVPEKDFKGIRWTLAIKKNEFKYTAGALVLEGTFKTDAKKFDAKGETFDMIGIFQLQGDRLTVCLDLSGRDRPSELKTKLGSNAILLVFKKDRP